MFKSIKTLVLFHDDGDNTPKPRGGTDAPPPPPPPTPMEDPDDNGPD